MKTLNEDKAAIEQQFNELAQKRQQITTALTQIGEEMARLQGEYRRVEKLIVDFKDEPKPKK